MHKVIKALIFLSLALIILLNIQGLLASTPEWHMINVNNRNQGDAHLLIDNGAYTLIDTGDPQQGAQYLIPYLQSLNISNIDHLFVSHPHTDHYGGMSALADAKVTISNIYYNLPPDNSDDWNYKRAEFLKMLKHFSNQGAQLKNISKGFSLNFSNSKITVIHAQKDRSINGKKLDINDFSLIMHWDANGFRTLFTGDLNKRLGTELAKLKHIKADILKVPHHGVSGIAPDTFFDRVDPSMLMFPSTRVLWTHPRGLQARNWTLNKKTSYCHNGLNGNVVLKFGENITVSSQQESQDCPNGKLNLKPGAHLNEPNSSATLPTIIPIITSLFEE